MWLDDARHALRGLDPPGTVLASALIWGCDRPHAIFTLFDALLFVPFRSRPEIARSDAVGDRWTDNRSLASWSWRASVCSTPSKATRVKTFHSRAARHYERPAAFVSPGRCASWLSPLSAPFQPDEAAPNR